MTLAPHELQAVLAALSPQEQRAWLAALLRQKQNAALGYPDLAAEAVLEPTIRVEGPPRSTPRAYFLTGATGFVGAALLHTLLARTDARVVCLVRARTEEEGRARLIEGLTSRTDTALEDLQRISVVTGDIAQRRFGLEPARFEALCEEVDAVIHSAASLNWIYPYELLAPANATGTQEALRLACSHHAKPFHHISSLSVVLPFANFEDVPLMEDTPLEACKAHTVPYAASKWVSEALVMQARARGLPASIYRPPFVGWHTQTAVLKPGGDLLDLLLRSAARTGIAHARRWVTMLLPVDYLAEAIVTLALRPDSAQGVCQDFHFDVEPPLRWNTLLEWMRACGYRVQEVDFDTWIKALRAAGSADPLFPLIPLLSTRLPGTDKTAYDIGYLRDAITVDTRNTRAGLQGALLPDPTITFESFQRCLAYSTAHGLIAPARAREHR